MRYLPLLLPLLLSACFTIPPSTPEQLSAFDVGRDRVYLVDNSSYDTFMFGLQFCPVTQGMMRSCSSVGRNKSGYSFGRNPFYPDQQEVILGSGEDRFRVMSASYYRSGIYGFIFGSNSSSELIPLRATDVVDLSPGTVNVLGLREDDPQAVAFVRQLMIQNLGPEAANLTYKPARILPTSCQSRLFGATTCAISGAGT
ncbi:hypothetical protein AADZ90_000395 [Aestuariibius sp. 2305UL40-4]|uniref:hypothetical protein n=1 Tax=Aestuariibius violaceus TaxID=3234132 RepID=UPI00345E58EC